MYNPRGNGKEKAIQSVHFNEVKPPKHLSSIVHRFLELKTNFPLPNDYRFHALPDSCTYIIFNQIDTNNAGITKLNTSARELNLGKVFHYINIRLLPGVWQNISENIYDGMINLPYNGNLSLTQISYKLTKLDFTQKQVVLSEFIEKLIEKKLLVPNFITEKIFENLDDIHTVADMARVSCLSARQLQRTLKQTTGFTPHDFLKILRLQRALTGHDFPSYADQSHFIHSFRKATGYTPIKYHKKYDV